MRAYQQSAKHSAYRVNDVDETPEEEKSDDNVAAVMGQSKFAVIAKRKDTSFPNAEKNPMANQIKTTKTTNLVQNLNTLKTIQPTLPCNNFSNLGVAL